MFRSLEGRDRWHFCENCPAWPWAGYEVADDPPRDRWCKTCVRMYEAGTGDLEELPFVGPATPSRVYVALCNAFSAGKLGPAGAVTVPSSPTEPAPFPSSRRDT